MLTIPADYIFQIIWLQNCNLKKLDDYGERIICPFYCGSVFQESLLRSCFLWHLQRPEPLLSIGTFTKVSPFF